MNIVYGKNVLVFWNSKTSSHKESWDQRIAIADAQLSAQNVTVYDVDGAGTPVREDAIITYIGTLTANTYDDIIVTNSAAAQIDTGYGAATTGKISYDHLGLLIPKLKTANQGTVVVTGTAVVTNSDTSHIQLAAGAVATTHYYDSLYVTITAGTNVGSQIKKATTYSLTNTLLTIGGAVYASAIDATSVYALSVVPHLHLYYDAAYSQAASHWFYDVNWASEMVHEWLYGRLHGILSGYVYLPGNVPPALIAKSGTYLRYLYAASGTVGGAAATLTDSAAQFAVNLAGCWVYIKSGTGANQWAYILSNTTTVLTVSWINTPSLSFVDQINYPTGDSSVWNVNPGAGTTAYYVVENFDDILKAEYIQLYVKTYLYSTTMTTRVNLNNCVQDVFQKCMDWFLNIKDIRAGYPPSQDTDEVYSLGLPAFKMVLDGGKKLYDMISSSPTITLT